MSTTAERAAEHGLPFDHVEYVCPGHEGEYYATHCMFCDGGLFACSVCGSFEGATTTQCPGRKMTSEESDSVYAGDLDFRNGEWVYKPSYYSPGGFYQALTDEEKQRIHDYEERRDRHLREVQRSDSGAEG